MKFNHVFLLPGAFPLPTAGAATSPFGLRKGAPKAHCHPAPRCARIKCRDIVASSSRTDGQRFGLDRRPLLVPACDGDGGSVAAVVGGADADQADLAAGEWRSREREHY